MASARIASLHGQLVAAGAELRVTETLQDGTEHRVYAWDPDEAQTVELRRVLAQQVEAQVSRGEARSLFESIDELTEWAHPEDHIWLVAGHKIAFFSRAVHVWIYP